MNFLGLNSELEIVIFLLLISLVVFAVSTVMVRNLLKAAIALAATSAILTVVMFLMGSFLAAVFELSVCAGLITVVFVSTISLTKPQTKEEMTVEKKQRMKKYIYLPILLIVVAVALILAAPYVILNPAAGAAGAQSTVEEILWNIRPTDMLGQIIVILAGVFGVVILFKGRDVK